MNGDTGDPEIAPTGPRRSAAPSRARRSVVNLFRLLTITAAVVVVAAMVFGWVVGRAVSDNVTTLPADLLDDLPSRPPEAPPGVKNPVTVLLIGSDRRIGRDVGGGVTGERADGLMLVRMSGDRSHVDVLALPRDAWVPVPGHGEAKINASLAMGGVPLVVHTVETLTGLRVDHVLVADFTAVREVTARLGGVTVTNPVASTDPLTGTRFDAGPIVLEGDRALTWVRHRYGLPGGDLDRIVHQQQLLAAIAAKITDSDVLSHPGVLYDVIETISRHLTVDSGLTAQRMTELLRDLAVVPRERIRFYTAPVVGGGRSADGQAFLRIDRRALAAACTAIGTDQPVPIALTRLPSG